MLLPFTGIARELTVPKRAALAALIVPRYLTLSCPTPAAFAADRGVTPGTPAYATRWHDLEAQAYAALASSYGPQDGVSALFATTAAGTTVALATMQTIRGTSLAPLALAIGEAASTLPTHRTLQFRYPPGLGLDPTTTPEVALAEFSHLVVANPAQLRPLVIAGAITTAEARYVVQYGIAEMLVLAVQRDQAQAAPPLAYLFNTTPLLARIFQRKGLAVQPLFLGGAAPTARLLAARHLGGVYFRRWPAELARVVPPAVLGQGVAAAIRYLVAQNFRDWHRLAISLPYLLLNDARLTTAIARLACACQRARSALSEDWAAD